MEILPSQYFAVAAGSHRYVAEARSSFRQNTDLRSRVNTLLTLGASNGRADASKCQQNRKEFEHPLRSSRKERKEKRLIPCKWCGICISGVPEIKIPHRPSAGGDKSSILQANRGVYFGAMPALSLSKGTRGNEINATFDLCELRDFC